MYYICAIYIIIMILIALRRVLHAGLWLMVGLLATETFSQLTLIEERVIQNNKLSVVVSSSGAPEVLAMQGSFRFDGKSLSFDQVEVVNFPGLAPTDFSLEGNSTLNMVFIDPDFSGVVIPENTPLFVIHFTILNSLNTNVVFSNCPLGIEAIAPDDTIIPVVGDLLNDRFCTVILGNVYQDFDRNCRTSDGDLPFANVMLEVNGPSGLQYVVTDNNGRYQIVGIPGVYDLKLLSPEQFWEPCEETTTIVINNINNPRTYDYYFNPTIDCPTMEVRVGVSQFRPCTREVIFIHYRNAGTIPANNTDLEVRIDERLEIVDINMPHTITPPRTIFIATGNLAPNESGIARITVDVPCDDNLIGSAFCISASGRPAATCLSPGAGWSGANLRVNAACQNNRVVLTATNMGNSPMSASLPLHILIDDGLQQTESIRLNPSQSFTWDRDGDGRTYTILSEQVAGFPVQGPISASVEGCGTSELPVSKGFTNQFPKQRSAFADHRICVEMGAKASAGTATKWSHLKGYNENREVKKDAYLEYVITASGPGASIAQMLIIDTLQGHIDPGSFRIEASSHPIQLSWGDRNIVYMLADLSEEPVSANEFVFVQFSVKFKDDLTLPFNGYNIASAYRTLDAPVLTNTLRHQIVDQYDDFLSVSAEEVKPMAPESLRIFPNPANELIFVDRSQEQSGSVWNYSIYSIHGSVVDQGMLNDTNSAIGVNHLPAGVYLMRITTAKGEVFQSRFAVAK